MAVPRSHSVDGSKICQSNSVCIFSRGRSSQLTVPVCAVNAPILFCIGFLFPLAQALPAHVDDGRSQSLWASWSQCCILFLFFIQVRVLIFSFGIIPPLSFVYLSA